MGRIVYANSSRGKRRSSGWLISQAGQTSVARQLRDSRRIEKVHRSVINVLPVRNT